MYSITFTQCEQTNVNKAYIVCMTSSSFQYSPPQKFDNNKLCKFENQFLHLGVINITFLPADRVVKTRLGQDSNDPGQRLYLQYEMVSLCPALYSFTLMCSPSRCPINRWT